MSKRVVWLEIAFVLLLFSAWDVPSTVTVQAELEDEIIVWAQSFGDELWQLSQSVTKLADIKSRYKGQNAKVQKKDGVALLNDIVENVETMMKYKMDAIKCIMTTVESEASKFDVADRIKNHTYFSSKFSEIEGKARDPKIPINRTLFDSMALTSDHRFFNIPVNHSHSSVHVPTNLNDRAPHVLGAIQWSEALEEVFLDNYNSDPALSWQFFGSSTGFLRNFPAMEWNQQPDQYDCRMRPWYIEAATCTKDVVILMDTTGSMRGMRMRIAKLTVNNILDTLTSNDFVNVFNFSDTHQPIIPCFDDTMLVQASNENVNAFKEGVNLMTPEGHANFSIVFTMAFELLAKYRDMRGCNENNTGGVQCNQAIMLVTDGLPYNITEVFEEYNWFENGTNIPVRIFSFLIGREVFKVKEIQLIACLNRGFYKHVHSLDEVREGVFSYIPVLARPLVLQGDSHPITWTTTYSDTTDSKLNEWLFDVMEHKDQKDRMYKYNRNKRLFFSQREADRKYIKELKKEPEELKGTIRQREYHLQITVSVPAFDRKATTNNYTNTADLLGVAGTDIFIDHIKYLTRPYKLGVNGYAFIVNNNGIVILHPDLRPVSHYELKDNFNSVDISEVEIVDDDRGSRDPSPEILELREAMINHSEGQVVNLRMKYHYDDMHRVVTEGRDIFYAPLKGTPFSLAISLPHEYGFFQTSVRSEEVKYTLWEAKLLDFFKGYDWKIRPDWIYCRYHHENLHPFDSAERELRHFLEKMEASRSWKWKSQYDSDYTAAWKYIVDGDYDDTEFLNCNRNPVKDDSYYCEKDLVQLLIYDAKVTSHTFKTSKEWTYKDNSERELMELYNATLRFISTQSGLTRWQYMLESDEHEYRRTEFGNLHKRAIDESWYIAAVLQHQIDPQSFVYSLSFDRIGLLEEDAFITGSYAIFPRENGMEAPASVVGLQFRQSALAARFFALTANDKCPECREQCASEELDCFVLDSGGYVIVSEKVNDTGRFFGEIDGAVMEAMVTETIFKRTTIYDYQALCFEEVLKEKDAGCSLVSPVQHIHWFIQWLVGEMTWLVFQTNLQDLWATVSAYKSYDDDDDEYNDYYHSVEVKDYDLAENETETVEGVEEEEDEYETIHHPCDQKADLYELDQDYLKELHKEGFRAALQNCSRPFYVRSIPHSNLLLLVVDAMHGSCFRFLSADMVEINHNETHFPCKKIYLNSFPRRKLAGCFTQHPEEEYIRECGDDGTNVQLSFASLFICLLLVVANYASNTSQG